MRRNTQFPSSKRYSQPYGEAIRPELVEKHLPSDQGRVVLHWFSGTKAELRRAVDLGCYFSVNTRMAGTEKGRGLISGFPLDRILTETDGPFTETAGQPTRPQDTGAVVDAIARLRGTTFDKMADIVHNNLKTLLGWRSSDTL